MDEIQGSKATEWEVCERGVMWSFALSSPCTPLLLLSISVIFSLSLLFRPSHRVRERALKAMRMIGRFFSLIICIRLRVAPSCPFYTSSRISFIVLDLEDTMTISSSISFVSGIPIIILYLFTKMFRASFYEITSFHGCLDVPMGHLYQFLFINFSFLIVLVSLRSF